MTAKKKDTKTKVASDMKKKYGPLRGSEWLELDQWAFQELPRKAYALFQQIADYHKVPVKDWLAHVPENGQPPS